MIFYLFQTCYNTRVCGIRTPEVVRRESLGSPAGYWPRCNSGTGLPSPCESRLSTDLYPSRYRGSLTSIPSPGLEVVGGPSRRHSWRATAASFDTWRIPVATSTPRPTWSSMPSSPTHVQPLPPSTRISKTIPKRMRSKVTFQGGFELFLLYMYFLKKSQKINCELSLQNVQWQEEVCRICGLIWIRVKIQPNLWSMRQRITWGEVSIPCWRYLQRSIGTKQPLDGEELGGTRSLISFGNGILHRMPDLTCQR